MENLKRYKRIVEVLAQAKIVKMQTDSLIEILEIRKAQLLKKIETEE